MLENTNALIATAYAVWQQIRTIEKSLEAADLDEDAEEELGLFLNDLQAAFADLGNAYCVAQEANPQLLAFDRLLEKVARKVEAAG